MLSLCPTRRCPAPPPGVLAASVLAATALFACQPAHSAEDADRFAVPENADAGTLLQFIAGLANPGHDFESRAEADKYRRQSAVAIAAAAEKVMVGEATDKQLGQAIEMKVAALHLLNDLGQADAEALLASFLGELRQHKNPAAKLTAVRLRATDCIHRWSTLPDADKSALFDEIEKVIAGSEASLSQVRLLTYVADVLGDTPQREQVLQLVENLTPQFEQSDDPAMQKKLEALAGVARRLRLPGEPIEVEGKLLSGKPVDWQQYRGDVVLIDYWATWCGLCHAELPNIRQLEQQYGDRGFKVLGVSLDDDKQKVEQFLSKHKIPWPTLIGHSEESRGWNHPMVGKYGIHDLPRAILVDQQGHVVHMNARGKQLASELHRLLGKPRAGVAVAASAEEKVQPVSLATER